MDIQAYVPYRLLLIQQLRPAHFTSQIEYALFGERQLAAFTCGLLAAVRSVDRGTVWEVGVGIAQRVEELNSDQLEVRACTPLHRSLLLVCVLWMCVLGLISLRLVVRHSYYYSRATSCFLS